MNRLLPEQGLADESAPTERGSPMNRLLQG
jgi:hypothetical protein